MARWEKKEETIKGIVAGLIAAIVMYFLINSFHWVSITKYDQNFLAGNTVFNYKSGWLMQVVAFVVTLGIGAFWGVIFAFLFSKVLTEKNWWLKSLIISFSIFVFHFGILDEHFHYPREIHEATIDLLVFLLGYIEYGLVTTWLLKKMGIFSPPHP